MSETVIRVENLSKRFIISHEEKERYSSLRDEIVTRSKRLLSLNKSKQQAREEFWALNDLNFEIKKGDRVGIIGRNGAGKSTLLKVLSRITEPSKGRVTIDGRVASLLEVGTGFHPELTGRENIFLNGAILGMTRAEIRKKFDEIVAFAEVEKFLDTPVKRYSSGMYVRLAFAVAAHLEPEILIVDEVLAVGDIQFQKKCLGKMEDVSLNEGRTVLFVSHNMAAIQTLTKTGIILSHGTQVFNGATDQAIKTYTELSRSGGQSSAIVKKGDHTKCIDYKLVDDDGVPIDSYLPGRSLNIEMTIETDGSDNLSWELFLIDAANYTKIALASLYQIDGKNIPSSPGRYTYRVRFNSLPLASGNYYFDLTTSIVNVGWDNYIERAICIDIPFSNPGGMSWDFKSSYGYGSIALSAKQIDIVKLDE